LNKDSNDATANSQAWPCMEMGHQQAKDTRSKEHDTWGPLLCWLLPCHQ